MKKPAHQWETRRHRAHRVAEVQDPRWAERMHAAQASDPRTEAFELRFGDGTRGVAVLSMHAQWACDRGAGDPDLPHAVRCWLAARGQRSLQLVTLGGDPIATGDFTVQSLGAGPGAREPMRIVSLAPSNAEQLAAIDCFERVIACEDSSDFPAAVQACERLGPDLGPDLDRIETLRPELVVSSLSVPGMERVVTGLHARGIPQIVLAPRSLADVQDDARRLARALGVPERGEAVAAVLERERTELARAAASCEPVRVYLEWWPRPMYTPGRDCYSNELIALAGGVNVFGDRPGSSLEVTAEDLVRADPDVCFVSWCGVPEAKLDPGNLLDRDGLTALAVVRRGHVFALDEAFSGRPGPRMLEASRRMAAKIHAAVRAQ